jgi:uncharacterized membrane protein YraQ (UPF0718 family)
MDDPRVKEELGAKCCPSNKGTKAYSSSTSKGMETRAFAVGQPAGHIAAVPKGFSSCCSPEAEPLPTCCGAEALKAPSSQRRTLALSALALLAFAFMVWVVMQGLPGLEAPLDNILQLGREMMRIGDFVARAAWRLLSFFILSIGLAAWLKVSGLTAMLHQAFKYKQWQTIVVSSLIGALTPFCSCGVIPIIASMLVAGVPLAPVMSFWISSPLMNPQVFFITMGTLGASMALARLISAIFMGLAAGFVTLAFERMGFLEDQLRPGLAKGCDSTAKPSSPAISKQEARPSSFQWHPFILETGKMGLFLGKWLLAAFVLEALVTFYVPDRWIYGLVGSQNQYSVLIATLVGIPAYVNSLAAIPVVQGLVNSGMDKGAALAFFTAGAVTTIPAMVAVLALVRRTTFILYLSISFIGALAVGMIYGMMA